MLAKWAIVIAFGVVLIAGALPASAQAETPVGPNEGLPVSEQTNGAVVVPQVPDTPEVTFQLDGDEGLSQSVSLFLLLTVGAILPGLLLVMTSFTRYVVVLGITKNAIGLQTIPPSQVLIGLALFLTIFTMSPTLEEAYNDAVVPLLEGEITQEEAMELGFDPFRRFMLAHADMDDLEMFAGMSGRPAPATPEETSASVLVPAFVVSELRQAFLIGFVIFVPFLVIDLVVSAILMSMGMVMLPPVFISLPLKLLLFVLVDGWSLIISSTVGSVLGVT
ncbi:MAG: flagellar type III secretion system pore protein FliP [Acidimicrobiia bacterium]